ncbi:hypothetical protein [Ehrlichia ruminantium]|uniref:hypothetical protein n=1 Tax=Ehrlichia ruminantium TaxID=779 RepID=UPI0015DC13D1|nr:hypothetical protein [Ehrlichia ruminantium]QLK57971.1 hypothetical protein FDZ59_03060 [Ehrlichia ruminantium]UOD97543.1 hypothetical protein IMW64_03035 [Ehrlichia ruminantium]
MQLSKEGNSDICHVNTPTKELLQAQVGSTEPNKQINNTETLSKSESSKYLTRSYLKNKFTSIISSTESGKVIGENTESKSVVCSLKVEASDSTHSRRVTVVETKNHVNTTLANIIVDPQSTLEVHCQDI